MNTIGLGKRVLLRGVVALTLMVGVTSTGLNAQSVEPSEAKRAQTPAGAGENHIEPLPAISNGGIAPIDPAGLQQITIRDSGAVVDGASALGGSPTTSDCCYNHVPASIGCEVGSCQSAVCGADPFCCNTNWDTICAERAASLCGSLCTTNWYDNRPDGFLAFPTSSQRWADDIRGLCQGAVITGYGVSLFKVTDGSGPASCTANSSSFFPSFRLRANFNSAGLVNDTSDDRPGAVIDFPPVVLAQPAGVTVTVTRKLPSLIGVPSGTDTQFWIDVGTTDDCVGWIVGQEAEIGTSRDLFARSFDGGATWSTTAFGGANPPQASFVSAVEAQARGAFEWRVVGADKTAVISQGPNSITVPRSVDSVQLELELHVFDWDPNLDGVPGLKAYQVTLDSADVVSGNMIPTVGVIDEGRPDFVFSGFPPCFLGGIGSVDTMTSFDFRYGETTSIFGDFRNEAEDCFSDGIRDSYAGTLVLDNPAFVSNTGTFEVGFVAPNVTPTGMVDDTNNFVCTTRLIPATITVVLCTGDADCNDMCASGVCSSGVCFYSSFLFGDVDHNDTVNIFDLLCVLASFAGNFSNCSFVDADINPCGGNGDINIFDLLAVLGAFAGNDPCCGG